MAITYKRCEEAWTRRRGKTWKAVERDCRLTMDGDDFIVTYHGWYKKYESDSGIPLLRINRDDIVTVLNDGQVSYFKYQTTVPNRFSALLGRVVYRSAMHFKNREYITRIGGEPFFAGLQIDMKTNNLLNPKEDMRVVVDKGFATAVRQKSQTLRKLTMGMARMGAFDDLVSHRLKWQTPPQPKFEDINIDNPTGEDARAVVIVGLHSVNTPNLSYYNSNNQWTQRSTQEQGKVLLDNAVQTGLKLLRRHIYDTTENAYVKVPAKQRGD